MPLIDLSRQTTLEIDVDSTLIVSGIISIVNSGILDVVAGAVRIDGEPIGASAAEINLLSGLVSNVQDQINTVTLNVSSLEDTPWNVTTLSGLSGGSSGLLKDGIDLTLQSTTTESLVSTWFANIRNITAVRHDRNTAKAANFSIHSDFHTAGVANNLNQWMVFINGQFIEIEAINSIYNSGNQLRIDFNTVELGFILRTKHEIMIWGPIVNG